MKMLRNRKRSGSSDIETTLEHQKRKIVNSSLTKEIVLSHSVSPMYPDFLYNEDESKTQIVNHHRWTNNKEIMETNLQDERLRNLCPHKMDDSMNEQNPWFDLKILPLNHPDLSGKLSFPDMDNCIHGKPGQHRWILPESFEIESWFENHAIISNFRKAMQEKLFENETDLYNREEIKDLLEDTLLRVEQIGMQKILETVNWPEDAPSLANIDFNFCNDKITWIARCEIDSASWLMPIYLHVKSTPQAIIKAFEDEMSQYVVVFDLWELDNTFGETSNSHWLVVVGLLKDDQLTYNVQNFKRFMPRCLNIVGSKSPSPIPTYFPKWWTYPSSTIRIWCDTKRMFCKKCEPLTLEFELDKRSCYCNNLKGVHELEDCQKKPYIFVISTLHSQ